MVIQQILIRKMLKAQITINFKEIAGNKVTPELVTKSLKKGTKKTIQRLCKELENYFKNQKIKVENTFEIITYE